MPLEWQRYAREYWLHLAQGVRQPGHSEFGLSYADAQQIRVKLATLAGLASSMINKLAKRYLFSAGRDRMDGQVNSDRESLTARRSNM
jgi:hypothetical protein